MIIFLDDNRQHLNMKCTNRMDGEHANKYAKASPLVFKKDTNNCTKIRPLPRKHMFGTQKIDFRSASQENNNFGT